MKRDSLKEVASAAQTAWFGLLGFLAFYFLVVLSTQDVDFLLNSKETTLPLVDVKVATVRFFLVAPVLATALYGYLHFYCLLLWRQAREANAADLEAALSASLIGTLALTLKRNARPRGMSQNASLLMMAIGAAVAGLLIWVAQPALLLQSLVQSDAAPVPAWTGDDGAMSLRPLLSVRWVTLGCLGISVFVGALSLIGALSIRFPAMARPSALVPLAAAALAAAVVWPLSTRERTLTISGAELAGVGAAWAYSAEGREDFRRLWCDKAGIPTGVCAVRVTASRAVALERRRRAYCQTVLTPRNRKFCAEYFARQDAAFAQDWGDVRRAALARVPQLDLAGRDLSGAHGAGLRFPNARMEGTDLTGADLDNADLEGAVLIGARLIGTAGQYAIFDRANLTRARLAGAELPTASFERAILVEADLRGANLTNALLDGAELDGDAALYGADLRAAVLTDVRLQRADLTDARLDGAILDGADLSGAVGLTQAQLDVAAGRDVLLPRYPGETLRLDACWKAVPREAWSATFALSDPSVRADAQRRLKDRRCAAMKVPAPRVAEELPAPRVDMAAVGRWEAENSAREQRAYRAAVAAAAPQAPGPIASK